MLRKALTFKYKKLFSCIVLVICAANFSFSQNTNSQDYLSDSKYKKLSDLLTGYLENDLELKKAGLEARSKALSLESTKIDNGIDIKLSSGTVSVSTDTQGKSTVKVNPNIQLDIPVVSDGELNLSLPYTIEDGKSTVSDGSISATVGIISGSAKQRKISILEAERAYTQAKQALINRALEAEKEFYENLKKLYNYAISIHTYKSSLYDDTVDLRVLETKGYSKTSASYRQAYLKVESDRRDVQEKQRLFERETAVFAMKCGFEFSRSTDNLDKKNENGEVDEKFDPIKAGENAYQAAINFLPDAIPNVKSEKIFDYKKEDYSSVENANWDKYIGQLKRDADYEMSLTATGEYKFNSNVSNYDDAGGKLNFNWRGLTASAGAYVPLKNNTFAIDETGKKNDNPYFQFSLSISPNEWRTAKIEKEQNKIESQKEDIAIQSAVDDYETDLMDKVSSFHDIKWSERSYAQEYEMYNKLESDMAQWLQQGIVTENDYLDAFNNKEKARINIMINAIDMLIYNDEVKLLFCQTQGE